MSAGVNSPTTTMQARPTRAQLDEQVTWAMVHAAGDVACVKCGDSGYLTNHPSGPRQAFGLLAWSLDGVPADQILWCDCARGRAWRQQYVQGMRHAEGIENIYRRDEEQARIDAAFERAGIPTRFESLTFDTIPEAHRAGKEPAIAAARQFAEQGYATMPNGKRKDGLCFVGLPGVGKTGLLSVAFRARLAAGQAGLWIELYSLFHEVQSQYGRDGGDADARIRAAQRAELLMLDDCGDPDRCRATPGTGEIVIAPETDDRRRILWEILDHRHGRGQATLITSNLSRSDFDIQWGTRLAARVWELCRIVPVLGVDLRTAD